ncbi:serine/threonine-protein kinase-like protein CCR3 [Canna indica]|uniref:non-specific serine/threonine protein kinase n=1 Tax=Canna indica TaxID=4628 RepID=A0AAQ3KBN5_9LILI|nr:serine/threonine-protein kinase-like protein CCR3 [Canna indica]
MRLSLADALAVTAALTILLDFACATGSASTLAISHGSATVCGVLSGASLQSIQCVRAGSTSLVPFSVFPNASFLSISGGRDSVCGLRADGASFFCWNTANSSSSTFAPRRVYEGSVVFEELAVGDLHIAAVDRNRTFIEWWRAYGGFPSNISGSYRSLTSGRGFTCAVNSNGSVRCWGPSVGEIEDAFANYSMSTIVAGESHACGIDTAGRLICGGSNNSGQLSPPSSSAFEFGSVALGSNHTCAVRKFNGVVVCWGGDAGGEYTPANTTAFVFVVADGNITCGLTTENYTVLCWGSNRSELALTTLPLPRVLPGACTSNESSCDCGPFPDSGTLCSGSGVICRRCDDRIQPSSPPSLSPPQLPPTPPRASSKRTSKGRLVFGIIGSVGAFAGVCSIIYCTWFGVCRHKKVHNSVQPTIAAAGNGASHAHSSATGAGSSLFTSPSGSQSRGFWRQGSRVMTRQRSGPSSFKDRAEEFSFAELAVATKDFSSETKIGAGSFGTVYRGKLPDGREVAIKRSETGPRTKKFQEKESAFQSELAFLSRLHHKHLVALVGYCEEGEERLLVYDYMKNGALYDHLHPKNGDESTFLNSWKIRIKVLLDAARGIEYLHNYAVPPIIHRDIKSSNILLDANWVARVSDFGLSLMGPESGAGHLSMRAAGTVGYMDPEYYGMHHLTVKSDVYGLGVVMLEVLTGKRAIFKDAEDGNPTSVVDYALPCIVAGEVRKVLDERVGQPALQEAEAVELVAYTAVHCVNLEGKNRPNMTDIVANLESAVALCEGSFESHGNISSPCISPSGD